MKLRQNMIAYTAALAGTLGLASVSHAGTEIQLRADEPSAVVRYSELDLSSDSSVHALYNRIQDAAWRVCVREVLPDSAPNIIDNRNCRQTLVDSAVDQIDQPALTALDTGRGTVDLTSSG